MSQRSRRHDPYPWTWEIPLVTVLAILVLIIFWGASWSGDRQSGCGFGLEVSESGGSVQQPARCSARGRHSRSG